MNDTVKKNIKKSTDRPKISNFPLEGNITIFFFWPKHGDLSLRFKDDPVLSLSDGGETRISPSSNLYLYLSFSKYHQIGGVLDYDDLGILLTRGNIKQLGEDDSEWWTVMDQQGKPSLTIITFNERYASELFAPLAGYG